MSFAFTIPNRSHSVHHSGLCQPPKNAYSLSSLSLSLQIEEEKQRARERRAQLAADRREEVRARLASLKNKKPPAVPVVVRTRANAGSIDNLINVGIETVANSLGLSQKSPSPSKFATPSRSVSMGDMSDRENSYMPSSGKIVNRIGAVTGSLRRHPASDAVSSEPLRTRDSIPTAVKENAVKENVVIKEHLVSVTRSRGPLSEAPTQTSQSTAVDPSKLKNIHKQRNGPSVLRTRLGELRSLSNHGFASKRNLDAVTPNELGELDKMTADDRQQISAMMEDKLMKLQKETQAILQMEKELQTVAKLKQRSRRMAPSIPSKRSTSGHRSGESDTAGSDTGMVAIAPRNAADGSSSGVGSTVVRQSSASRCVTSASSAKGPTTSSRGVSNVASIPRAFLNEEVLFSHEEMGIPLLEPTIVPTGVSVALSQGSKVANRQLHKEHAKPPSVSNVRGLSKDASRAPSSRGPSRGPSRGFSAQENRKVDAGISSRDPMLNIQMNSKEGVFIPGLELFGNAVDPSKIDGPGNRDQFPELDEDGFPIVPTQEANTAEMAPVPSSSFQASASERTQKSRPSSSSIALIGHASVHVTSSHMDSIAAPASASEAGIVENRDTEEHDQLSIPYPASGVAAGSGIAAIRELAAAASSQSRVPTASGGTRGANETKLLNQQGNTQSEEMVGTTSASKTVSAPLNSSQEEEMTQTIVSPMEVQASSLVAQEGPKVTKVDTIIVSGAGATFKEASVTSLDRTSMPPTESGFPLEDEILQALADGSVAMNGVQSISNERIVPLKQVVVSSNTELYGKGQVQVEMDSEVSEPQFLDDVENASELQVVEVHHDHETLVPSEQCQKEPVLKEAVTDDSESTQEAEKSSSMQNEESVVVLHIDVDTVAAVLQVASPVSMNNEEAAVPCSNEELPKDTSCTLSLDVTENPTPAVNNATVQEPVSSIEAFDCDATKELPENVAEQVPIEEKKPMQNAPEATESNTFPMDDRPHSSQNEGEFSLNKDTTLDSSAVDNESVADASQIPNPVEGEAQGLSMNEDPLHDIPASPPKHSVAESPISHVPEDQVAPTTNHFGLDEVSSIAKDIHIRSSPAPMTESNAEQDLDANLTMDTPVRTLRFNREEGFSTFLGAEDANSTIDPEQDLSLPNASVLSHNTQYESPRMEISSTHHLVGTSEDILEEENGSIEPHSRLLSEVDRTYDSAMDAHLVELDDGDFGMQPSPIQNTVRAIGFDDSMDVSRMQNSGLDYNVEGYEPRALAPILGVPQESDIPDFEREQDVEYRTFEADESSKAHNKPVFFDTLDAAGLLSSLESGVDGGCEPEILQNPVEETNKVSIVVPDDVLSNKSSMLNDSLDD